MRGLIDSTLREGEQRARVYFTLQQKIAVIGMLARTGIDEIEIGTAAPDSELKPLIEAARSEAPQCRVAIWCRCLPEDIKLGASFMPDVLSIALPVSDVHLENRLGKTRQWALDQIPRIVDLARSYGVPYVSLGFEDATRADPEHLNAAASATVDAGCDRIRLADTVGISTPARLAAMVSRFARRHPIEVGIHAHNDFGMATANTLTALDAGAHWADVTVLGIGERAGNARLEEIAGFLNLRRNMVRYRLDSLRPLVSLVSSVTGEPISRHHPVIGQDLFTCESGIHLDGLAKDPATYEPYPPEAVGATRTRLIGKKSGVSAVLAATNEFKLKLDAASAAKLTACIRATSRACGRPLTRLEITRLAAHI
ncbi:MAG: LeuA family protein [Capsulimonadaceae bacterium]